MKKILQIPVLFIISLILVQFSYARVNGKLNVTGLKVEGFTNPLGTDYDPVKLSWGIKSNKRGTIQTSYRILAASTKEKLLKNEADIWDTKVVTSDQNVNIPYAGKKLNSRDEIYWKVKIWDNKGKESEWSPIAKWTVGLLNTNDWNAKWIGFEKAFASENPKDTIVRLAARYFRKEFTASGNIEKATLYVTGLGTYYAYINGKVISNQVLAPGQSEYPKRVYYSTFDVTNKLQPGNNAIGLALGTGRFFSTLTSQWKAVPPFKNFGFPKLIAQLEITYKNGTVQQVISDNTWKGTADGPVIDNSDFNGEKYDARKEMPGWNKKGFNDSKWNQAELVKSPTEHLTAMITEPEKVEDEIKPVSVKEVSPGKFVFDMGQNLVGWVKLKVHGASGSKITMRFAERLMDNELYTANLRSAEATDVYTLKGGASEEWEPGFTYHGFRYVEMTGFPGKPNLKTIIGKVVNNDMNTTGTFTTSNDMINKIYHNAFWGIRGNYHSVPTDCPQRDERMGWLGDRSTGSLGESFVMNNHKLYEQWLQDIADAQKPDGQLPDLAPSVLDIFTDNMTWPSSFLVCSDMIYEQYADPTLIIKYYPAFKKWMDYMKGKYMVDNIMPKDQFGDWCMPSEDLKIIHSTDPARQTPPEILGTTFYYRMTQLMKKFAVMSNNAADTVYWNEQAEKVYNAFNDKLYNKELGYYGNNTVTSNVLALAFDLVPQNEQKRVFQNIIDKTEKVYNGHISTGLVGAQWLMRTLNRFGRPDVVYNFTTQKDYPSWGYMVENGATTIWELWNGNTADPAMNSGNHVMLLGDLVTWYYENLAGIKTDPSNPGFKKIIMKPELTGDLKFVKSSYNSVHGEITSKWQIKGNQFNWDIDIPANTTALIYIPAEKEDSISESGKQASRVEGLKFIKLENGSAVYEAGSGSYHFVSKNYSAKN
jgi:alpha-L-rhamnosidase